jgi:tRNA A-37 threonylcarbamoyl transferase component Bud32
VIGRTVGHYEIEAEIGRGGMGVVYRARDTRLNRAVAFKTLPPELARDDDRKNRFLREARAACAVNHPAIAQIYDVGEAEDVLFLVMELVEGRTLRELLRAQELDVLGALEIAMQVAGGLAKAHESGVIHRDIKADNIMVTSDGHAKILDFGLAKLRDLGGSSEDATALSQMETAMRTRAGVVVGTLQYMSPEQARGHAVDPRSDVFSLGVVLYEMVTGQLPFCGASALDTLHAIAFDEVRPVTSLKPNLPASLQRIIVRCLRKKREDRYEDAHSLLDDLRHVKEEVESGTSRPVPLMDRLQEQLRALRDLTPGEWLWRVVALAISVWVVVALVSARGISLPGLLLLGGAGLLLYRYVRNRPMRLVKRFSRRVARLPEVRYVIAERQHVTVVADRALAKTCVHVSALMDDVNSRLFFGQPFQASVIDNVSPVEAARLMSHARTLYARRDLLEAHDADEQKTDVGPR